MNLQLQSEHALLLILTVVPVVLYLVYWLYPQTASSDAGWLCRLLRVLRFITIALLLFLLVHPLITFHHTRIKHPVVGLLLDDSQSMTVTDNGQSRGKTLSALLQDPAIKDLRSRANVLTGLFSNQMDTLTFQPVDSLSFQGIVTNFARTFQDFENIRTTESVRDLILISDGRMSAGENPLRIAQSFRIPIHTIVIGDSAQKPDLILDHVEVNPIVYVGQPVQFNFLVRSPGFTNQIATATLRADNQILTQKKIALISDQAGHPIQLEFTPEQPGFQKIVIELSRFENEMTYENNQREIYVQVLKRKIQIVLIAGQPSPDVGGIMRILTKNPDLDLKLFTLRDPGSFYEGAFPSAHVLQEADVLLLIDVPTRGFPQAAYRSIQQALQSGVSLLWMAGSEIDHSQLQPISTFIPFSAMQSTEAQLVAMQRTETGRSSPITQTGSDDVSQWQRLPSIYSGWSRLEPKKEAAVLVESEAGVPLITAFHSGQYKTVALTGSGWTRLDMLMRGIGGDNQVIRTLFENSLRWLALRESIQPVQLEMEKRIYRAGEEMVVLARIFDDILRPVNGARVRGIIQSDEFQNPLTFEQLGEGRYRSNARSFAPGENQIMIQANLQDQMIGRDTVSVMIESFNPEYLNTRANPRMLRSIARATGGRFGTVDSLASILNGIQYSPISEENIIEWKPFGSLWILILLILMLSMEWLIRKRSGML
ncbi:VWA domain-containing protein [candidate division KSB1 bacterium]|nr:VWA domain-containing protein [candidate division KSB1 bacterium]